MDVSVYNIIFCKYDDGGNRQVDKNGNTIKYELKYKRDSISIVENEVFDWVASKDIQPIKLESEVE